MLPAFIAALLLTMALGGVTTAALPYLFWRTPQTRFALVVALLVAFALLTLAPLGFPGRACRWRRLPTDTLHQGQGQALLDPRVQYPLLRAELLPCPVP